MSKPFILQTGDRQAQERKAEGQQRFTLALAAIFWTQVGEYRSASTPVSVLCNRGHSKKLIPSALYAGNFVCKICKESAVPLPKSRSNENASRMKKGRDRFLAALAARNWEPLGEYAGSQEKVAVRCDKGHEMTISPTNLYGGSGCGVCYRSRRKKP